MKSKSAFISLFFVGISLISHDAHTQERLTCDVVVVGGGVAGLYTAYQLSKNVMPGANNNVCLFEKENHLGGRVFDLPHDNQHPELVFGLGALRVLEGQEQVIALAKELGITLVASPYHSDLYNSRGRLAFSSDEMKVLAYPLLSEAHIDDTGYGTERALISLLYKHLDQAGLFYDYRSFARHFLSPEGFHFLQDMTRLRGEFHPPCGYSGHFSLLPGRRAPVLYAFISHRWDVSVCCEDGRQRQGPWCKNFHGRKSAECREKNRRKSLSNRDTQLHCTGKISSNSDRYRSS